MSHTARRTRTHPPPRARPRRRGTRGASGGSSPPKSPSFNEKDISDKPAYLRPANRMTTKQLNVVRYRNERRLESLRAVDEGIAQIFDVLAQTGRLDRTYVIFQSDNGFFRGEHRITKGKTLAYEPSSRVPLMIRGPGIPAGVRPKALVLTVDVAPTISALTEVAPSWPFDGTSLLPFATTPRLKSKRPLLIESYALTIDRGGDRAAAAFIPKRLQRYQAIRTGPYKYIRLLKSKEEELYHLGKDPGELRNLAHERRYRHVLIGLRRNLKNLAGCVGADCRRPLGKIPKPTAGGAGSSGAARPTAGLPPKLKCPI